MVCLKLALGIDAENRFNGANTYISQILYEFFVCSYTKGNVHCTHIQYFIIFRWNGLCNALRQTKKEIPNERANNVRNQIHMSRKYKFIEFRALYTNMYIVKLFCECISRWREHTTQFNMFMPLLVISRASRRVEKRQSHRFYVCSSNNKL